MTEIYLQLLDSKHYGADGFVAVSDRLAAYRRKNPLPHSVSGLQISATLVALAGLNGQSTVATELGHGSGCSMAEIR